MVAPDLKAFGLITSEQSSVVFAGSIPLTAGGGHK